MGVEIDPEYGGTGSSFFIANHFIGGGNLGIRRKPPTCRKSLTNFIT
jgi:hypothetical protein